MAKHTDEKTEFRIFFKHLMRRVKASDVPGIAAQMAYFFLLALFPLMIFMVTLLGYLPIDPNEVFNIIKDFAPSDSLSLVQDTLLEVTSNQNGGLLSVGVLGTIWSASNAMNAVIKGLNYAYDVKETRAFYVARGLSVLLTFAFIFIIAVMLILQVFGEQIGEFAFEFLGMGDQFLIIWTWIRFLLPPVVLFLVFVGLYYLAPNLKVKYVTVLPGAIFATIGWIIVSLGFSFYVNNFGNYSATYGSIGGVIILMIWLYLSAMILLVGGEVNALRNDQKRGVN
ncbi:YihY/virulence factor BrkB family protein [Domibacillus sp. A3M-37]|uniref:YihY/virulence factor BrkB family protein n=1 Tax=Domibacillus TaxID=1433999 RepID=UPI0009E50F0E|nr:MULTISPECIES: YihY/virulence factor BrkB family protein [Domibacillus]MCP3762132.1 YihY/virulence factor BrkB family protein [Domibacillus sp. A3M-37]